MRAGSTSVRRCASNGEPAVSTLSRQVGAGRRAIKLDRPVERGAELTVRRDRSAAASGAARTTSPISSGSRSSRRTARAWASSRTFCPAPRTTRSSSTPASCCRSSRTASAMLTSRERRVLLNPASPADGYGSPSCVSTSSRWSRARSSGFGSAGPSRPCSGPSSSCASSTTATRLRSRAGQVDDEPYGGGPGMVLRVDVVAAALDAVYGGRPEHRVVALTPQGRQLDQDLVEELAARARADAPLGALRGLRPAHPRPSVHRRRSRSARTSSRAARFPRSPSSMPSCAGFPARSTEGSGEVESFSAALNGGLEYPHYTRPADFRGWTVPGDPALGRPRPDRLPGARSMVRSARERSTRPLGGRDTTRARARTTDRVGAARAGGCRGSTTHAAASGAPVLLAAAPPGSDEPTKHEFHHPLDRVTGRFPADCGSPSTGS